MTNIDEELLEEVTGGSSDDIVYTRVYQYGFRYLMCPVCGAEKRMTLNVTVEHDTLGYDHIISQKVTCFGCNTAFEYTKDNQVGRKM